MKSSPAEGLSVNEIFRQYGEAYAQGHRLTAEQGRVIGNLRDCRTGALGGTLSAVISAGRYSTGIIRVAIGTVRSARD